MVNIKRRDFIIFSKKKKVLNCCLIAQNVHILRTLSEHNISSRMINQLLNIQYLIDTPQTTIQGFVVSVNCYNFQEIFKQVSSFSFYFHFSLRIS